MGVLDETFVDSIKEKCIEQAVREACDFDIVTFKGSGEVLPPPSGYSVGSIYNVFEQSGLSRTYIAIDAGGRTEWWELSSYNIFKDYDTNNI